MATVAFVVMVAGMIATPLFARGGDERRLLAVVVVGALFACGLATAVHTYGHRAALAAAGIVVLTFVVEIIGSTTGFPFGTYDYT
ncbi:MAG: carotenoid biosynthesis protein, partial [Actinomycetota bacterium]